MKPGRRSLFAVAEARQFGVKIADFLDITFDEIGLSNQERLTYLLPIDHDP
jgi:hypothetical protein